MKKRKAVAAAVRTEDGLIHFFPAPCRHHHTVHALHRPQNGVENDLIIAQGEQGFVMSDGTFADRIEAGIEAINSGQIKELQHPPMLFSEDLW